MKTKKIILQDGWNPNMASGTKVVCTHTTYAVQKGTILEYRGGCDHPEYGWAIHLEGGEPNYFPGETPREVGTHSFAGFIFEENFEEIVSL